MPKGDLMTDHAKQLAEEFEKWASDMGQYKGAPEIKHAWYVAKCLSLMDENAGHIEEVKKLQGIIEDGDTENGKLVDENERLRGAATEVVTLRVEIETLLEKSRMRQTLAERELEQARAGAERGAKGEGR